MTKKQLIEALDRYSDDAEVRVGLASHPACITAVNLTHVGICEYGNMTWEPNSLSKGVIVIECGERREKICHQ